MTPLDILARMSRQYECGSITATEFVTKLTDYFAGDPELRTEDAATVAALLPADTKPLVLRQLDVALSPGYMRQAFALGWSTKEKEQAAALRETARERAWAAALRPLLS